MSNKEKRNTTFEDAMPGVEWPPRFRGVKLSASRAKFANRVKLELSA
jgi:hypothetical protein